MPDTLKMIFPSGHLGASAGEGGGVTMLRVIAVAFGGDSADSWSWPEKYGAVVENDVFLMRPDYQDAECECGWSDRRDAWHERNPHATQCYHVELRARQAAWDAVNWDADAKPPQRAKPWTDDEGPEWQAWRARFDGQRRAHRKIAASLCRERKIQWRGGWGSAVHCDCGVDDAFKMWMEWERHGERCPHALPNFWFKPTGFRVTWYKYIGRDMRSNGAEVPPDMLAQIFATHPSGMTPDDAFALLAERTAETHREWDAMLAHLATTLPPNVVLK